MFFRRFPFFLAGALGALASLNAELDLESDSIEYNHDRQEVIAQGKARLTHEGMLLTANQIVFNEAERVASAQGNVVITGPDFRATGDEIRFHVDQQRFEGDNIRAGSPPFLAEAGRFAATSERYDLTNSTFYIGEPQPFAANVRAHSATYHEDERIEASNVVLRVGRQPVFFFPGISRDLGEPRNEVTLGAGHSRHLGLFVDAGIRFPVHSSVAVGADVSFFTRRGLLAGPGAGYSHESASHRIEGSLLSGYIRDREDPGLDRLGRPIDPDRYFGEWRHKHFWEEQVEITGSFSGWSDSEVTRDFRSGLFSGNQFPDNYLEAVYLGDNYVVSMFTRASPNDFQVIQERLPEVRYDYLPKEIGAGIIHRFQSGLAVLREDRPSPLEDLARSDRLDAYYQLSRPFTPADWLTITPVAGGRLTHYERPLGDREPYTRYLGEVGFDADFYSYGIYNYHNHFWGIDGIRHVVNPRIEYRLVPESDQGEAFIPPIDRRVFMTRLEPIGLDSVRNIDDLGRMHTLRYGLNNIFQTRERDYGSRDLLTLYLANDLRFSRESGENLISDIQAETTFSPIYWLRFDGFGRFDSRDGELREHALGLTITDARFWSLRLGADYLQELLEQYSATYYKRLNDIWGFSAEARYDVELSQFTRQTYSLIQNIHQTWEIQYQLFLRDGAEREGSTGVGISVSYLAF